MPIVRVLPEDVINKIAAGEVVERPASVLKELLDNALDAGAGRVEVALESAGLERITVIDDGSGMSADDAERAFERHATSKIADIEDLSRVRTLGFRGEALSSIAAVSRLTLETAGEDGEGVRLRADGGDVVSIDPLARPRGTTVDVRRLFYNTPARRKFLKTHATEQATNVRRLLEAAFGWLDVAWTARHGGRSILDLAPAATLAERLASLHGPAYAETLLPFGDKDGSIRVRGLVQKAAATGAGRRRQFVFVNGRPIDGGPLARAVLRGYRSTLPAGAKPDLYLFVDVEPDEVDVNVHPAKREVRFRAEARVASAVEDAVRGALGSGHVAAPSYRAPAPGPRSPSGRGAGQLGLFFSGGRARPRRVAHDDEPPESDAAVVGAIAADDGEESRASEGVTPDRTVLPSVWQLHDRFILAQTATGVVFIDQHSAHERILYEEVIGEIRERPREGQRLLFPAVIHLTPEQHATWEEYRGLIDRLGFEIEPFGGDAIAVAAVPSFRHTFDAETALVDLLDDLSEPGTGSADMNQHERIARMFACKAAIKAGQRLEQREMAEIIDRLFATELPYDDVHGRPAVVQIALEDLNRQFGRH